MKSKDTYKWQFRSVGGVVRVVIEKGEDLAHLGELDQKYWTVLSCPVEGLDFDPKTLTLLDTDGDGKIRVPEMVAAASWLTSVLKDKDQILKASTSLPLKAINADSDEGKALLDSAKNILAGLGLDKEEIALEDIEDQTKIFAGSRFTGDGVITATTAESDEIKKLIGDIAATVGSVQDRSGEAGVGAAQIEAFYAAAEGYKAWCEAAVMPFGDNTPAVLAAVDAVAAKVKDYFLRCKLIAFDGDVAASVDVSADRIGAIAAGDLSAQLDEIAKYPIARPSGECLLSFAAVNPAWRGAMDTVKALVPDFAGKDAVSEAEWDEAVAKLAPYTAWQAAKAGAEVEPLGLDAVKEVLKENKKQDLLDLVAEDLKVESAAAAIDNVCKLVRYNAYYFKLLNNYLVMTDFYKRNSVFEAGRLYIDGRCCELCLPVMGAHADMASLSGMFLIYCTCTSKVKAATRNIVAVLTAGSIRDLRPGKNGVFYDRSGQDWDAVITSVVDNPISVAQAFWGPYRKLGKFVSDKIDKNAADKDAAATTDLLAKADGGAKQPFDIAKFSGIFAAVGLAVGALGAGLGLIISAIKGLVWWKYLVIIAAVMLVISGPACFIAWRKLRKRNLGPVLNANGWAVNSSVLVNDKFGRTLTSVAKYPKFTKGDPYATPGWKKWFWLTLIFLIALFAVLYFTGNLACLGL